MLHNALRKKFRRRDNLTILLTALSCIVPFSVYQSHASLPPIQNDHNIIIKTQSVRNLREEQDSIIDNDGMSRAVFYNIFVPPPPSPSDGTSSANNNNDRIDNALDIVAEQLLRKSISKYAKHAPIYYTLIGHNATGEIQQRCDESQQQQCHLLEYTDQGDESLTLQSLWEYCQEHPSALVTYIHNKGSFHPSDRNTRFRTMLTKSVFSDQCQTISDETYDENNHKQEHHPPPPPRCNTCSARFSPLPHWHMPGNMWTAQCQYVRNLHAPQQFESKMQEMVDSLTKTTTAATAAITGDDSDNNKLVLIRPSDSMIRSQYLIGLGRYSMEHWLGSHPDIHPCDVYDNGKYRTGYSYLPDKHSRWKPRLQEAPWSSLDSNLPYFVSANSPQDWYCGQGRLVEFSLLYNNKEPSEDSFFWSYYANPSEKYCPPTNLKISATISS